MAEDNQLAVWKHSLRIVITVRIELGGNCVEFQWPNTTSYKVQMNKSPQGRPWRELSSLLQSHQDKQLCRHPWKSIFPQLQCIYYEPWQDYHKSSIKPRGAYLFQAHLRWDLIETGGLFN